MLRPAVLAMVIGALLVAAAPARANDVVVRPGALGPWALAGTGTASAALVSGPAARGAGSVQLSVGADGSSLAQLERSGFDGAAPPTLSRLSYATYTATGAVQRVAVVYLFVDTNGDNAFDDVWIFDPYFQNAPDGLPDQGAVQLGAWQRWDALAGGWYSSSGLAGSAAGNVKPFASLVAAAPGARLRPVPTGALAGPAVRFVAGDEAPFAAGAVEYVDDVEIGSGQTLTRTDFEPDDDGDGVADGYDDCPTTANGEQTDTDRDGRGDACDADDDGDGVPDNEDQYPLDPTRSAPPSPTASAPQPPPTSSDRTPPSVTLAGLPSRLSRRAFLRGLRVTVKPSESAALGLDLRATARAAHLARYELSLATASLAPAAGARTVLLHPSRRLIGPARRFVVELRITATDAAGNRSATTRTIRVTP